MVDTFKLMGIILLSIKTVKGEPLKCRPSQKHKNCKTARAEQRMIDWLVLVWFGTVHLPLLAQPQELQIFGILRTFSLTQSQTGYFFFRQIPRNERFIKHICKTSIFNNYLHPHRKIQVAAIRTIKPEALPNAHSSFQIFKKHCQRHNGPRN